MTTLICDVEDCKHRSKRPLRSFENNDGTKVYGCTLDYITIKEIFDCDGDYFELGERKVPICSQYAFIGEEAKSEEDIGDAIEQT